MRPVEPLARPLRCALAALATALVLVLGAPPTNALQPASTYPPGILSVDNTAVLPGADFQVLVVTNASLAVDQMTVTVCRFQSVDAQAPDVCFMNPAAKWVGDHFAASTGDAPHPKWEAGWVLGYKVTTRTTGGELHAPEGVPSGYYLLIVGAATDVAPTTESHAAPAALAMVVAALALAGRFGRKG